MLVADARWTAIDEPKFGGEAEVVGHRNCYVETDKKPTSDVRARRILEVPGHAGRIHTLWNAQDRVRRRLKISTPRRPDTGGEADPGRDVTARHERGRPADPGFVG